MRQRPPFLTYLLHLGLFLLAWVTTMLAGSELITGRFWLGNMQPGDFWQGWPYSLSFLAFLTFHEFGHYFTALYHQVRSSLPYYIPIYIPFLGLNIGSMGAVIVLKQVPDSTRKYFDIGVAGPLAGFVISLLLLGYGFTHLPPLEETVMQLHPEYQEQFGGVPDEATMQQWLEEEDIQSVAIGSSLLFELCKDVLPDDPAQVPPAFELMHYPYLFVGFITLFFTALNLLPIGQLDGGHVMYGLFGRRRAALIARSATVGLLVMGGTGFLDLSELDAYRFALLGGYVIFLLYVFSRIWGPDRWQQASISTAALLVLQLGLKAAFPSWEVNPLWLLYTFLVIRVIKLDHPPAFREHPLSGPRKALGWLAIAIFVLCFTPEPIQVIGETDPDQIERRLEEEQE
jgi:membrane-associated protease RseP (regulator of RpoE activity)